MILLPKYRTIDLGNQGPLASMSVGCKGEIRAKCYRPDGRLRVDTGWTPNHWLDQGMDDFPAGTLRFYRYALGDSAAATADAQTGLQGNYLGYAQDNNGTGDSIEYGGTPDWELTTTRNRRFGPGVATGTVREVVISDVIGDPGTGGSIRALVSPEIVKAADETLDVFYKWTIFLGLVDATKAVTIDGLVYDTVSRWVDVDSSSLVATVPYEAPSYYGPFNTSYVAYPDGSVLSSITGGGPSGAAAYSDNDTEWGGTYTPGNHWRDWYHAVGLNGWNHASGIRCLRLGAKPRTIQISFVRQGGGGETVPKDETRIIENVQTRFSWARH